MSTTICPRCGGSIVVGAHFCSLCGNDVSGQQASLATEQMTAPPPRIAGPDQAVLEQMEHLRDATLGEYEIYGELGRGGMATVYLAHEIALDRKVAIKVMSPALVHGEGMVERFKREARTSASLSHPNIIPVYAVRETDQILYFVMKFVQGRPLDSILKEVGALPISMVQAILQQVGGAFGYAHRRGIIHRDIKPANIMIDDEGWAVVTDFGIAKVSESQGLTMTGMTVGTPTYMSPEQCMAQEVSGASDQYSLGVVAYEMITGRPPFQGASMMAIMYGHFNDPPPPIEPLRPDCPAGLGAAVMQMLEKDPAKRWPSVEDAIALIGGLPLSHDEPTRNKLIALAKNGVNTKLLNSPRTPTSPIPPGKRTRAGIAAATSGGRSAANRTAATVVTSGASPGTTSTAVAPPKSKLGLILGAVVTVLLLAGTVYVAPWRKAAPVPASTPDTTHSIASPAPPVQTPAMTSPSAGPATDSSTTSSRTPDTAAHADPAAPRPTPTPTKPAQRPATVATKPQPNAAALSAARDDSLFQSMRAEARDIRAHARTAGAGVTDLAAGDALAGQADLLAQSGKASEAVPVLSRATRAWSEAGVRAQSHPPVDTSPRQAVVTVPVPTPVQPVDERPEIERVIRDYGHAMEAGQVDALRRANPGLTAKQQSDLDAFFRAGGSLKPNWTISGIEISGGTASARIGGTTAWKLKRDSGQRPVDLRAALERAGSGWRLTSVTGD
ncbi:MAG: protein kinase [Gemmatimonadota bacterium]